jgi:hypothetical protein
MEKYRLLQQYLYGSGYKDILLNIEIVETGVQENTLKTDRIGQKVSSRLVKAQKSKVFKS